MPGLPMHRMRPRPGRLGRAAALACLLPGAPLGAAGLACHVSYGGETRVVAVAPAASPYEAAAVQVGSYFLFRPVLVAAPRELAGVHVYTYADLERGPALVHQASFPWPPPPAGAPHGFTGLHRVYEPLREGELEYWCEAAP